MRRATWAVTIAVAAAVAIAGNHLPIGRSDDCATCAEVLALEARWLTAITAGDRATVETILAPDFRHITSEGVLLDRAQEIATTVEQPFTMNPSEQTVDLADRTAVVHGVNTLIQSGKVVARERFTDVFVMRDGQWVALAAQETEI